jgi:salicylate hydroxylase
LTTLIGIIGGGIGGLAAAIALRHKAHDVVVFERARQFMRVGADITLTPNAVRALHGFGVNDIVLERAARPTHRFSRAWDNGEETSRLEMGDAAQSRYGAPLLTIHRADLIEALSAKLPSELLLFGGMPPISSMTRRR